VYTGFVFRADGVFDHDFYPQSINLRILVVKASSAFTLEKLMKLLFVYFVWFRGVVHFTFTSFF